MCVTFLGIKTVHFHPFKELRMVYDVLFKGITGFIDEVDMNILIIRVHFSSSFVDWHEHRFNTGSRLGHQAGCSGWSDGQAGDISSSHLHHFLIEGRVSLSKAVDVWVVLFALTVVDTESTTLFGHFHR